MTSNAVANQERVRWLHATLLARGWQLGHHYQSEVDGQGYPTVEQPIWFYPGSYGGQRSHVIDDLSPEPLEALYSLGAHGDFVGLCLTGPGVEAAPCPRHRRHEQVLDLDEDLPKRLASALEELEPAAAAADIHDTIHCRFFGACGETYNRLAKLPPVIDS